MKAKQLIDLLKKCNQDLDIVIFNGEFWNDIENISEGNFDEEMGEYYDNPKGKKKRLYLE